MHASGDKKYNVVRHMRWDMYQFLYCLGPQARSIGRGGGAYPLLLMATNISLNFWGPDKTVSEINEIDVKI